MSKVRRTASAIGLICAAVFCCATITLFLLCYTGKFSNADVELADALQDQLSRLLMAAMAFGLVAFILNLFSFGQRRIVSLIAVLGFSFPLLWLFFVNMMRRN